MTRRRLTALFTILIVSISVFAGGIKDGSLSASSDGANITIRWMSEDESGVSRFVLERKAGINGAFMPLVELTPKGNNASYQYVDDSAFRATESIYKYQVKVVYSNGNTSIYGPITVSHRTSDVRRTWGSIKAMFR